MANFARHSYGTDWIPKYSENMWRMKKEDIERRRNDRGKMIEMKVGLGQRLDTSKNADIEKRYGPGAIDTFNLKADRIKEERETSLAADATKKRRDTQKFVWERQTQALAKANSIGDMLKKMENPLTGGVRPETRETYSHLTKNWNELLKQAGIDVEGFGSLSQKDKEAQAKDAFLEKATVAYNAALKDPTDENIMAFKQANSQGKVLKDMRFDVFDEATLTKRQIEKKKDEQKAKVAELKRKHTQQDKITTEKRAATESDRRYNRGYQKYVKDEIAAGRKPKSQTAFNKENRSALIDFGSLFPGDEQAGKKELTREIATEYLKQANNNKDQARENARKDGYEW